MSQRLRATAPQTYCTFRTSNGTADVLCFATFVNGTADVLQFSKLEKNVKNKSSLFAPSSVTLGSKQTNVNISWDVWQNPGVTLTACGPQHIFTFVILSGGYVMKIRTCDLDASEFIGNSWRNAQFRKNIKCESDQNDEKMIMCKSIGNSCQNAQEDVL